MKKIAIELENLLLCQSLQELLSKEPGCLVVVTHRSRTFQDFTPDFVLVDATTLQSNITTERWPEARIVLIDTGLKDEEVSALLLNHKLNGIISTDTDRSLFQKAITMMESGQLWIDNAKIRALLNHVESVAKSSSNIDTISKKEQEIIILVSQGCRNREIAARLFISEQTVKAHISRIFKKVNVTSRSQLVPLAMKYKLTRTS